MLLPLSGPGGRTNIPFRQLLHAMDSETTAGMIDQVDLSEFQPRKTFTPDNAVMLAAIATAAFSTKAEQAQKMQSQSGVRSFATLDSADNAVLGIAQPDAGTNVSVVELDQALVVAVSGASTPWLANHGKDNAFEWKDWMAALDGFPRQNYAGTAAVHSGFKAQADAIWDQLKPLLLSAQQTNKAIHFTGHSMGASVALLLAERLHHETGELPQSVLRLGGPDVGWSGERRHHDETGLADRVVNVVNSGDFVPHALPGGKTPGHCLFVDGQGLVHQDNGQHRWDRLQTKAYDVLTGRILIPMYRHFPQFYVSGLADERNRETLLQLESKLA
jgi:hypothetical protein